MQEVSSYYTPTLQSEQALETFERNYNIAETRDLGEPGTARPLRRPYCRHYTNYTSPLQLWSYLRLYTDHPLTQVTLSNDHSPAGLDHEFRGKEILAPFWPKKLPPLLLH